jgi:hypothetical protein
MEGVRTKILLASLHFSSHRVILNLLNFVIDEPQFVDVFSAYDLDIQQQIDQLNKRLAFPKLI